MEQRDYMEPNCPFDTGLWRKIPEKTTELRLNLQEFLARYDAQMARGKKEAAGDILRSSLYEAKNLGDRHGELSIYSEMMGYYRQAGLREEGLTSVEAGLNLLCVLGLEGSLTAGTILINAATALSSFGEHRRALGNFQEAFRCYGKSLPPTDQRWAALMNNMAAAYEALGETQEAERYYRSALDVQRHGGGVDIAVTHINLAQILCGDAAAGEWAASLEALNNPALLWDEYYAFTCRKCAAAFDEAGMHETARELRERAEIIHEST